MSREIKFRAWNNANNEWLNKEDAECLTIYLDGRYEMDMGWVKVFPDLIIEQYTGLKDKNGKDIYEGDIISFENEKGLARVLWLDGKAMFGLKWLDCGVEDELDYWNVCRGPTEVIGNIHENPEWS